MTRVEEVCRKMDISYATFFKWKKKYCGLGVGNLRRLRQLEEANNQLKKLVAHLSLDKLKSDDRLECKVYKGIFGNNINVMLAATAINFKRMCNKYRIALLSILFKFLECLLLKSTESSGKIRSANLDGKVEMYEFFLGRPEEGKRGRSKGKKPQMVTAIK